MKLKTKLIMAAVPVASLAVAGAVVGVGAALAKRRRKRAASFMPEEVRAALEQLCSLNSAAFLRDGLGSSVYQRKLGSLTDRQLVGVYLMVKLASTLRDRGVDLRLLTPTQLKGEMGLIHGTLQKRASRTELLHELGSIGAETALSILGDALTVASVAVQAA